MWITFGTILKALVVFSSFYAMKSKVSLLWASLIDCTNYNAIIASIMEQSIFLFQKEKITMQRIIRADQTKTNRKNITSCNFVSETSLLIKLFGFQRALVALSFQLCHLHKQTLAKASSISRSYFSLPATPESWYHKDLEVSTEIKTSPSQYHTLV